MLNHNLDYEQRQLEEESKLSGAKRFNDRNQKHAEKGSESLTKHGKRIIAAVVDKFVDTLRLRLNEVQSGPEP